MSLSLRFAATSDVGRVRRDNQDSGYAGPHLVVVADGVGGAARGDIASSACVEVLRKLDVPDAQDGLSALAATIHLAHDRLAEIVDAHPEMDGTSTTVSAALFDGAALQVGHVGDSRGYLLREGALRQITSDHSLVQSLVDEGRITEAEARVHPHRNLILKAVDSVHEPEPDLFEVPLQAGDRILFCSDGCSGVLDNGQLTALLAGDDLDAVATGLVRSALDAGSSDNVTVVVAEVFDGDAPSTQAPLVVGAAASSPHLQITDDRTGNLTDADARVLTVTEAAVDPEAIRYAPQPPPRRVWLRRLVTLVVVLGILAGAGYGGYEYTRTRYYVKADGQDVRIYRGVDLDLPLVTLSEEVRSTGFTLDDLGSEYTAKITDGVDKSSLAQIDAYVHDARCAKIRPSSTASTPADTSPLHLLGFHRKEWPAVSDKLASINTVKGGPVQVLEWDTKYVENLGCERSG
ncbi:serine/threonine protein phosphatase PrpC [Marmoricola sp. OAE513]|uniref:PP2C family protein-serine/threonine phosphatase n=1 Tax=Marmoricola sp. OAE513 TaxID=2817894 RepID=UPI001AE104AE